MISQRAHGPASTAAAILAVLLLVLPAYAQHAGERIYREGILPDGGQLRGLAAGDVPLRAANAACETCHRRSGYGLADSEIVVPPITGPVLFSPRDPSRADQLSALYQEVHAPRSWADQRIPRIRPAYTAQALKTALRDGVDPSGRPLSPAMPRYALDDAAANALVEYLSTLGAGAPPGIGPDTIRFATVIAGDVDPDRQSAMLDVMNAFIAEHNRETERELARPGFSPLYKSEFRGARRAWALDVWRLSGAASGWPQQLKRLYAARPVFALLGGLAEGEWQPMDIFCRAEDIPCLFPNTDMPPTGEATNATLYLAKGLPGEATALADWLVAQKQIGRIVQVSRAQTTGAHAAEIFETAVAARGSSVAVSKTLGPDEAVSRVGWKDMLREQRASAVVVWFGPADPAWSMLTEAADLPLYGSGSLLLDTVSQPVVGLPAGLRVVSPYALPWEVVPQIYRARAWLKSRHVRHGSEPLQLNTYFTMTVAEHAIVRMVDHFSRDYLIELVEHETENALNPGTYPHLSLGPHQRFASKGVYLVEVGPGGELRQLSPWIIPSP